MKKGQMLLSVCMASSITLVSVAGLVSRKSNVRLINNTPFVIVVKGFNTAFDTPLEQGQYGSKSIGAIQPGQTVDKIVWFERNVNIHKNKHYRFEFTISLPYVGEVVLQQQIIGTRVDSTLQLAIKSGVHSQANPKIAQPWSINSRDRSVTNFVNGNHKFIITYTSYFTGGEDDIWYTIDYIDEDAYAITAVGDNGFNLLVYNVYMRLMETFKNGQIERAAIIPHEINPAYDAIVFCEVFDSAARTKLLEGLKSKGYVHMSDVVGLKEARDQFGGRVTSSITNGGTMIVSRWPIVEQKIMIYQNCSAIDCTAKKGAVYAKINKNGKMYHLFGTHTNAQYKNNDGTDQTRFAQFKELAAFIEAQNISVDQPVLIGGDMNVDMYGSRQEYNNMLTALNATHPPLTGYRYSWEPMVNKLADQKQQKVRQLLDYALYSNTHRKPTQSFDRILYFKSHIDWVLQQDFLIRFTDRNISGITTLFDLSDHFPVNGYFLFEGY